MNLSEIIAHAKSKTPCASHYQCLLADLMELEAELQMRTSCHGRILPDGWTQIRTSFYKELLAIATAASKREED